MKWYIGAQNDALFIIDQPPRPSTDDTVDVADVSVIAGPLKSADAERIVGAWNILHASHARLIAALRGVIAVSDRKTVEYDEARAAIAAAERISKCASTGL